MTRPLHFQGHTLDADKVLAVDPVETHSTGSLQCQWSYGFTVRFPGNTTTILVPSRGNFGYSGGQTREQYKAVAETVRADFLKTIQWRVRNSP